MFGDEVETPRYSERPEWADITPVPQDDGPEPLAVIAYPAGFSEVHGYFRAIQTKNEFSLRALKLTGDVVAHNAANYTAWYYRRLCLAATGSDISEELALTERWTNDSPKNYQVWYHRRWLIEQLATQIKSGDLPQEEKDRQLEELALKELKFHLHSMRENDDYKNYNGWSHRFYIVDKFKLWSGEMDFVNELLLEDIKNNSAWNHRYSVARHIYGGWPLSQEHSQKEFTFTKNALEFCCDNESAWNYLATLLRLDDGQLPLDEVPSIEAFCKDRADLDDEASVCRFAVEMLARLHVAKGELDQAIRRYTELKQIDKIRVNYWDWCCSSVQQKLKV